jgi:hypothetical protein
MSQGLSKAVLLLPVLRATCCLSCPPPAAFVLHHFLPQLWASAKVLGRSSMRYYLDRCVPRDKRAAFIK